MKVAPQKVVSVSYTLTDDAGEVVDLADAAEPMVYLHGAGQLIPGVEAALDGLEVGAEIEVDVPAEDGYGEYEEELRMEFPLEEFEGVELEVGLELEIEFDDIDLVVRIEEITDDTVVVDANHELAGLDLHFSGKVLDIRDATEEELDHGHAHSEGEFCDGPEDEDEFDDAEEEE